MKEDNCRLTTFLSLIRREEITLFHHLVLGTETDFGVVSGGFLPRPVMKDVLDYSQFLLSCRNPHKLLYLLFVSVSAGSHRSICLAHTVKRNSEI